VWGVTPRQVPAYGDTDEMVKVVARHLAQEGLIELGDLFVIVSGQPVGRSGSTNMVQVRRVGDWEVDLPGSPATG
jgi:pyruvate kinase